MRAVRWIAGLALVSGALAAGYALWPGPREDDLPGPALEVASGPEDISPAPGAREVSPRAVVRVVFTRPVDAKTVTPQSFRLLGPDGQTVRAEVNCDLTGGVATLTPVRQLADHTDYVAELTEAIQGVSGESLSPFRLAFRTGTERVADAAFRFRAKRLEARNQVTTAAIGPDGHLYVADVHGTIRRYRLADDGSASGIEVVARLERQQVIGITFDPAATAERLRLWVSHARRNAGAWAGVVSRLELPVRSPGDAKRVEYIVGLPCPENLEHQPNGLAFSPDGQLYQAVGGVSTLGGTPNWGAAESPLSAAVIVADLTSPAFAPVRLPVNVRTDAPVSYNPKAPGAPVRLHATGLRNALDLCFHTNGHLYTATNANSIGRGVLTPTREGVPAVAATPREALCRVVAGKYYGHPNPSRGEYVLLGGNPTREKDPWEVAAYPVGLQPERTFDASLLYDLRSGGGNSANGLCEYTGPGCQGPLHGRLLAAYFSGGRCVQTFAFDKAGTVIDERPLADEQGKVLRFNQPLDVAVHPRTGRVYVVVFGNWPGSSVGSGVDAEGGGVWVLSPVTTPAGRVP